MCLGIVWENSGYGQGKSGNFIFKSRHLEREFCCSIVRNHLCSRHSLICSWCFTVCRVTYCCVFQADAVLPMSVFMAHLVRDYWWSHSIQFWMTAACKNGLWWCCPVSIQCMLRMGHLRHSPTVLHPNYSHHLVVTVKYLVYTMLVTTPFLLISAQMFWRYCNHVYRLCFTWAMPSTSPCQTTGRGLVIIYNKWGNCVPLCLFRKMRKSWCQRALWILRVLKLRASLVQCCHIIGGIQHWTILHQCTTQYLASHRNITVLLLAVHRVSEWRHTNGLQTVLVRNSHTLDQSTSLLV